MWAGDVTVAASLSVPCLLSLCHKIVTPTTFDQNTQSLTDTISQKCPLLQETMGWVYRSVVLQLKLAAAGIKISIFPLITWLQETPRHHRTSGATESSEHQRSQISEYHLHCAGNCICFSDIFLSCLLSMLSLVFLVSICLNIVWQSWTSLQWSSVFHQFYQLFTFSPRTSTNTVQSHRSNHSFQSLSLLQMRNYFSCLTLSHLLNYIRPPFHERCKYRNHHLRGALCLQTLFQ